MLAKCADCIDFIHSFRMSTRFACTVFSLAPRSLDSLVGRRRRLLVRIVDVSLYREIFTIGHHKSHELQKLNSNYFFRLHRASAGCWLTIAVVATERKFNALTKATGEKSNPRPFLSSKFGDCVASSSSKRSVTRAAARITYIAFHSCDRHSNYSHTRRVVFVCVCVSRRSSFLGSSPRSNNYKQKHRN